MNTIFGTNWRTTSTFLCVAALTGCTTLKNLVGKTETNVEAWWNNPATQAGLKIGLNAAEAALVSGAESAGTDVLQGGSVHWTDVGKSAASSAIRSIELTTTANNAAQAACTVSDAVISASHDPDQAEVVRTAVISGLTAAQANGADASGALDGVAQAIDAAGTPGK